MGEARLLGTIYRPIRDNVAIGSSLQIMSSVYVYILCHLGTIDKDYPKRKGGYAFEIGDSAAQRVLERIRPAISLRFITVCRKDSQDIDADDRYDIFTTVNPL